ncbi:MULTISPECIES: invasion associated locus B family protein [Komagataeibacter]|uniref:invasion associated locus B family protein n=1 Tax=Komagataeibacter TaxID=1434011 RepID=UPI0010C443A1|nr:invasion associated locus B family protein [Komagataeibacter saccharivorans]QBL95359.1 hypothetical protein KSAC_31800 [Komagataeibacter saccharivorans]
MKKILGIVFPIPVAAAAVVGFWSMHSVESHASAGTPDLRKTVNVAAMSQQGAHYILPNGASSLNETYQDWVVLCQNTTSGGRCAVAQQQSDGKTHQRILSVQLMPNGDHVSGVIILPFGLSLSKGVSIFADSKPVVAQVSFSTCVSGGCLVPVNFTRQQMLQLQSAKKLEVKASSLDNHSVDLPVFSKGLTEAMARITSLSSSTN